MNKTNSSKKFYYLIQINLDDYPKLSPSKNLKKNEKNPILPAKINCYDISSNRLKTPLKKVESISVSISSAKSN